jgi:hypothetical protein
VGRKHHGEKEGAVVTLLGPGDKRAITRITPEMLETTEFYRKLLLDSDFDMDAEMAKRKKMTRDEVVKRAAKRRK